MCAHYRLNFSLKIVVVCSIIVDQWPIVEAKTNYVCPENYLLVNSLGERWCFLPYWSPTQQGLNFTDSLTFCEDQGASLSILTTADINGDLAVMARSVWIGIVCDEESDTWQWQDGEPLNFTMFKEEPGKDQHISRFDLYNPNCSLSNDRFALAANSYWEAIDQAAQLTYVVCARRATTRVGIPAWGIAAIVIAALLLVGILIVCVWIGRKKVRDLHQILEVKIENERYQKDLGSVTGQATSLRYYDLPHRTDEWEMERKFISIDYARKLGEGAFGSVYCGRVIAKNLPSGTGRSIVELSTMNNDNDAIAVKMLHESADTLTERDFRMEIHLMKRIGYHERLVNILACVTLSEPMLLISEYCQNGDLLEFMKKRRKYMLENPDDINESTIITFNKQMMFAIQIAYGMEYLSSRGFIHRDLAARNILVDGRETCKIGDFGLCRAVGKEEENYLSHGGKLPLKWMSPEAIEKYNFSVASDVWSYGVLLFEIVTLGGTPYAGWPAAELLTRLKQGERMDRPENCDEILFQIMFECWAEHPSARPTFAKLRKRLGVLLEDANQDNYYLNLDANANYYNNNQFDVISSSISV